MPALISTPTVEPLALIWNHLRYAPRAAKGHWRASCRRMGAASDDVPAAPFPTGPHCREHAHSPAAPLLAAQHGAAHGATAVPPLKLLFFRPCATTCCFALARASSARGHPAARAAR